MSESLRLRPLTVIMPSDRLIRWQPIQIDSAQFYGWAHMNPCSCSYSPADCQQAPGGRGVFLADLTRLKFGRKGQRTLWKQSHSWVPQHDRRRRQYVTGAAELSASEIPEDQPFSTDVFPRIQEGNPWRYHPSSFQPSSHRIQKVAMKRAFDIS